MRSQPDRAPTAKALVSAPSTWPAQGALGLSGACAVDHVDPDWADHDETLGGGGLQVQSFNWRRGLDLVASAAMLLASALVVWVIADVRWRPGETSPTRPAAPLPADAVSLDGATLKGEFGARVVLLEFTDLQCPFCRRFARDTLPELLARYVDTGKVLIAIRHLPLSEIHPLAYRAAQAVECAGGGDLSWTAHRALLEHDRMDAFTLLALGASLGIDEVAYRDCLMGGGDARVDADMHAASTLGIRSTPTFLLGLRKDDRVEVAQRLEGAQPLGVFTAALEELLSSAR